MSGHEGETEEPEASDADVERLKAERDALQAEVEKLENRPERRRRVRRILTPALVILTVVVFTVTVPAAWGNRTILNTDRYVSTVAPLAEDPAVQASLARRVTDRVFTALDVQGKLSGVLPENLTILAAPMTEAVRGFIQDQVLKLVQTDAFARFWEEANRFAHTQVLAIPEVTPGTLPDQAVAELESALGVDLPEDFGSIAVYDSDELGALQQALYVFQRLLVLLIVLIPVLIALTLWVSTRRRRTLIQLAAGAAVGLVLIRRGALLLRKDLFESVDTQEFPSVRVLTDQLTESLFRYTAVLLAIVLLTLLVALVTGPYPWAVALRGWVRDAARSVGAAIGGAAAPETSRTRWIAEHRDGLMLGVAAVGVALLFFVDLSALWFLVVAVVVGLLELGLVRMRGREAEPA